MVKNKKPIINPKNNDDKYFQYAVTTTLNYQNNPKRISKVKPFIDQYHWKKKNFHWIKETGKSLN